ncbi:MAG: hypothetical protein QM715_17850 [Nibricoccus sp.]
MNKKMLSRSWFVAVMLGLIVNVAQAQISEFTVESLTGPGNNVQISGLFVSQNALLDVTQPVDVSGLVSYFSSFYTLAPGVAGTALATSSSWQWRSTRVVNQYAPNIGFTSSAPITNCSGRFYVEAPVNVWDEDSGTWNQTGGSGGTIRFTVTETRSFFVQVFGYNILGQYGLVGAKSPYVYLYNANTWQYVGYFGGEGTSSIGTLTPGNYIMFVDAEVDTDSGIVMASVNAN